MATFGARRARRESVEVVGAAGAEAAAATERAAGGAESDEGYKPSRGVEDGVEREAERKNVDGEPEGELGAARLNSPVRKVTGPAATLGLVHEQSLAVGRIREVPAVALAEKPGRTCGPTVAVLNALDSRLAWKMTRVGRRFGDGDQGRRENSARTRFDKEHAGVAARFSDFTLRGTKRRLPESMFGLPIHEATVIDRRLCDGTHWRRWLVRPQRGPNRSSRSTQSESPRHGRGRERAEGGEKQGECRDSDPAPGHEPSIPRGGNGANEWASKFGRGGFPWSSGAVHHAERCRRKPA